MGDPNISASGRQPILPRDIDTASISGLGRKEVSDKILQPGVGPAEQAAGHDEHASIERNVEQRSTSGMDKVKQTLGHISEAIDWKTAAAVGIGAGVAAVGVAVGIGSIVAATFSFGGGAAGLAVAVPMVGFGLAAMVVGGGRFAMTFREQSKAREAGAPNARAPVSNQPKASLASTIRARLPSFSKLGGTAKTSPENPREITIKRSDSNPQIPLPGAGSGEVPGAPFPLNPVFRASMPRQGGSENEQENPTANPVPNPQVQEESRSEPLVEQQAAEPVAEQPVSGAPAPVSVDAQEASIPVEKQVTPEEMAKNIEQYGRVAEEMQTTGATQLVALELLTSPGNLLSSDTGPGSLAQIKSKESTANVALVNQLQGSLEALYGHEQALQEGLMAIHSEPDPLRKAELTSALFSSSVYKAYGGENARYNYLFNKMKSTPAKSVEGKLLDAVSKVVVRTKKSPTDTDPTVLSDYLIKPMQRGPKFPLFLNDMAGKAGKLGDPRIAEHIGIALKGAKESVLESNQLITLADDYANASMKPLQNQSGLKSKIEKLDKAPIAEVLREIALGSASAAKVGSTRMSGLAPKLVEPFAIFSQVNTDRLQELLGDSKNNIAAKGLLTKQNILQFAITYTAQTDPRDVGESLLDLAQTAMQDSNEKVANMGYELATKYLLKTNQEGVSPEMRQSLVEQMNIGMDKRNPEAYKLGNALGILSENSGSPAALAQAIQGVAIAAVNVAA